MIKHCIHSLVEKRIKPDFLKSRLNNKYLVYMLEMYKTRWNLNWDTACFLNDYYFKKIKHRIKYFVDNYNLPSFKINKIMHILQLPTLLDVQNDNIKPDIDENIVIVLSKWDSLSIKILKEKNIDVSLQKTKSIVQNFSISEPNIQQLKTMKQCFIRDKLASSFIRNVIENNIIINSDKEIYSYYKALYDQPPTDDLVNLIKFKVHSKQI